MASEVIDITYGDLTPEALEAAVTDPAAVRSLDLSGNNVSPELCVEIVNKYVSKMTHLRELDLKDNRIGPSGCEALCKALIEHCAHLEYLDVNENAILDDSMYIIAVLLSQNRLKSLFLVTNHLTPRGIPTLCDGLLQTNCLTELSLDFNILGDAGAAMVAQAVRAHPSLQTLGLSDNAIGDAGAVEIASSIIMSPACRVQSLNLSVNRIGDVGFMAIAEALATTRNRRLHHLDLGCNPAVGERGRKALVACCPEFKFLTSLDLSSCNLSNEDAAALAAAMCSPRCAITRLEWYNNPAIEWETEQVLMKAVAEAQLSRPTAKEELLKHAAVVSTIVALVAAVAMVSLRAVRAGRLSTASAR